MLSRGSSMTRTFQDETNEKKGSTDYPRASTASTPIPPLTVRQGRATVSSDAMSSTDLDLHTYPPVGDADNGESQRITKAKATEYGGVETVDKTGKKLKLIKRETWNRDLDFLMASIGCAVGLGNIWRFPYLCYKNGGGAFLIIYYLFVVVIGIPVGYLEVAVGQFMGKGGLQAWNIVPLFQGIGLATCIVNFFIRCYYNVILSWTIYYVFSSFSSELPWQTCNHSWNTNNCSTDFALTANLTGRPESEMLDPVTEFWENKVLNISDGVEEMGNIKWDLALCLILAWIVVYCCISQGIKFYGKVIYVTVIFPYILMLILLIRNLMLDGAPEGLKFYIKSNMTKLIESEVWVDAGTQVFYSSSISHGPLTALGSYNKFTRNSYRDSIILAVVNSGTSLLAGFIVFTILGFMAKQQGSTVDHVVASGPGLAFIVYPKAVAQMPGAPFWSVLFFLMTFLLGIDSQLAGVESVITTVVDQFPNHLRRGNRKEIFIGVCCFVMFLIGLSMVTDGGMYVLQLFDYFSAGRILVSIALFELIAISYVYGIHRFYDNIIMMIGYSWVCKTLPYMLACWTVLSPISCILLFLLSTIHHSDVTYERSNGRVYTYPWWSLTIGWSLAAFSVLCVPVIGLYLWIKNGPSLQVLKLLMVPYHLEPHQKRPQDQFERTLYDHEKERRGLSPSGVHRPGVLVMTTNTPDSSPLI